MLSYLVNIFLALISMSLTLLLMPHLNLAHPFHALISLLFIGLLNLLIGPLLLGLGLVPTIYRLALTFFILNALAFNVAMGLVDDFGRISWSASILAAFLMTGLRVALEEVRSDRQNSGHLTR